MVAGNKCAYLCRSGNICGKKCYDEICAVHRKSVHILSPCLACGKGTLSKTGYCPCTTKQSNLSVKFKKDVQLQINKFESLIDASDILFGNYEKWRINPLEKIKPKRGRPYPPKIVEQPHPCPYCHK